MTPGLQGFSSPRAVYDLELNYYRMHNLVDRLSRICASSTYYIELEMPHR